MTVVEAKDWLPLFLAIVTVAAGYGGMRALVKEMKAKLESFQQTVITVAMMTSQIKSIETELERQRQATHDLRNLFLSHVLSLKKEETP